MKQNKVQPVALLDFLSPALVAAKRLTQLNLREHALQVSTWGWFPMLSLVAADALLVVALADTQARQSMPSAEGLFWLGLLLLVLPIAARLTSPRVTRAEVLGLVSVLGLGLYLIKVLHSPIGFTHFDEFIHWRSYNDIVETGHLFTKNLLLPISARYPALELVTVALTSLTGLPPFEAGVVVIGVARLVFVLALCLFFEQISGSPQVAGLATVLYMGNPNFLFFNAMFKYESLALSFGAVVLYTLARRQSGRASHYLRFTVMAGLALGGLVTSHHLTAFMLTGFLVLWAATWLVSRRWGTDRVPVDMTALAVVGNILWVVFVATIVIDYLFPSVSKASGEFVNLVVGRPQAARQLFVSSDGVAPLWQRLAGFGSVGLLTLALPFGVWQVWRRYRSRSAALALALAALGYPASLLLRLSSTSWEAGYRAAEFLFVAVGFIVALAVVQLWLRGRWFRLRSLAVIAAVAVVFAGGITTGWTSLWLLPGPYLPGQDTRSVDARSIAAAEWTAAYLGPDNVVGADRVNTSLMATYGDQHVRTSVSGSVEPAWVLFTRVWDGTPLDTIRQGRIQYMVVDRRLIQVPRIASRYLKNPDEVKMTEALDKFDQAPLINRVFDDGAIQIYDVGALAREQSVQ